MPAQPVTPTARELSFGSHPLQRLDFYRSAVPGPRPLILFVHGGAWVGGDKSDSTGSAKIRHYTQAGYQLASVNYRLLPEVDIERQADDVAASLAALLDRARELGIDTRRVVLMGHSAGAHLAALVATDPRYLGRYGLTPGDIGGVVLLDGAAYDVPSQIVDAGPLLGFAYQVAFGSGSPGNCRSRPLPMPTGTMRATSCCCTSSDPMPSGRPIAWPRRCRAPERGLPWRAYRDAGWKGITGSTPCSAAAIPRRHRSSMTGSRVCSAPRPLPPDRPD